jgi:hypothetical protein
MIAKIVLIHPRQKQSRAEQRYTIPTMHLIIEAENVFLAVDFGFDVALDTCMYITNGDLGVTFGMISGTHAGCFRHISTSGHYARK